MTQLSCTLTVQSTGERLAARPDAPFVPAAYQTATERDGISILVDDRVRYQTIEGFGGAFTEAAATTLALMPAALQEEILRAYFDQESGLGYTLCRTHINSCDFALGNYAYDETDGDTQLEHFSIDRDRQALLPMILRAKAIAGDTLRIFASPWSPPAWMKTTGRMNRGGSLKPQMREPWARYFVRYLQEYQKAGVPIWGVTVQNEPEAIQSWDSCIYTGEEERDFVRDYLGPALARDGRSDVKIIIWDHNRDRLYERAKAVLDDPEAARYVWGVGFHWYVADKFENVQLVHDAFPDKALLLTEACVEHGPHVGEWTSGERYARSVIQDLNHWSVGWVDWNLLLDQQGGPNHVGNYCSAPIIADTEQGELHYQSSFYYLGHFSKYLRPGARRILCATSHDDLEATAFVNPDGLKAVVAMNRTEREMPFTLRDGGNSARIVLPAHAIATLRW